MIKTLLSAFALPLALPSLLCAQTVPTGAIPLQRKNAGAGFSQITLSPVANSVWTFDASGNAGTVLKSSFEPALTLGTASQFYRGDKTPQAFTTISSVGTLTAGTWNATPVADAYIASAGAWNAKYGAGSNINVTGFTSDGAQTYNSGATWTYNASTAATHRTALGLTALATTTPSSTALAATVTDEIGTGNILFGNQAVSSSSTPTFGSLTLGNGTSSAPSLTLGDTATGFYRSASGEWTFLSTTSANRFTLNNSGAKLGSGTALTWSSTTSSMGTADSSFSRLGPGLVGLGNGTIGNSSGTLVANGLRMPSPTVPATAGAAGTAGDIAWDSGFVYVCVATNTWKRVAISPW